MGEVLSNMCKIYSFTVRAKFYLTFGLVMFFFGGFCVNVNAGKYVLKKGEAYVLISEQSRYVKKIKFSDYEGKEKFTVNSSFDLIKVKAGRYYLETVVSEYDNVISSKIPRPKSISNTIEVTEGATTYIGEWEIKKNKRKWDVSVDYPNDPMLKAKKKFSGLLDYPVYVATENGKKLRLAWD